MEKLARSVDKEEKIGVKLIVSAQVLERISQVASTIMKRLLYEDPVQFGSLHGYIHQLTKRKQIIIERHPLWQDDHPGWLLAKSDAEARYPGYTIQDMNPFIALRRPSDYA